MEFTAGGQSLAGVKIQRAIFQGDALSALLFVIAMVRLNHILRKYIAGYKLSKSQEKINHIHGRHQTFFPKRKRIGNPKTSSEMYNQVRGIGFGVENALC